MNGELIDRARAAVRAIDRAVSEGAEVSHEEIRAATRAVIDLRDLAANQVRDGRVEAALRDRLNALVSLAFGAEFPLSGLHLKRLKQVRDELSSLPQA